MKTSLYFYFLSSGKGPQNRVSFSGLLIALKHSVTSVLILPCMSSVIYSCSVTVQHFQKSVYKILKF